MNLLPELYRCNNCDKIDTKEKLRVLILKSVRHKQRFGKVWLDIYRDTMLCDACKQIFFHRSKLGLRRDRIKSFLNHGPGLNNTITQFWFERGDRRIVENIRHNGFITL